MADVISVSALPYIYPPNPQSKRQTDLTALKHSTPLSLLNLAIAPTKLRDKGVNIRQVSPVEPEPRLSLTYLGHSAVRFQIANLSIYVDPYFKDPVDWTKLPKGDLVIFSHGHFDHGILATMQLWEAWKCSFVGPRELIAWMLRKYRKIIPRQFFIALAHNESTDFKGVHIQAVPAYHPVNRLGKTILTVFARSSAPGKPVNGYFFGGYYHAGDTIYLADIAESLRGCKVHTACLPIGGKYGVAAPKEALRIAEEIGAQRIVPLHWQPLVEQVPFRYQSSDLVRLGKTTKTKVSICALAIGEVLEPEANVEISI